RSEVRPHFRISHDGVAKLLVCGKRTARFRVVRIPRVLKLAIHDRVGRERVATIATPLSSVLPPEKILVRRTLVAALSLVVVGGVRLATAQAPTQPPTGAQAPAANGDVRGKVVEMKSDAPVARASVSVRPKGGTVLIAGAIAGGDGTFRIQGLRPGAYS